MRRRGAVGHMTNRLLECMKMADLPRQIISPGVQLFARNGKATFAEHGGNFGESKARRFAQGNERELEENRFVELAA